MNYILNLMRWEYLLKNINNYFIKYKMIINKTQQIQKKEITLIKNKSHFFLQEIKLKCRNL